MGDTLMTVGAIVLAAILMFVFPLMAVSERSDDISQLAVKNSTVEFVDKVRSTGKVSLEDYKKFISSINSTTHTYDVEMEIKVLDENPGVKTTQTQHDKIGENVYYTMYTTQIMDKLNPDPTNYPNGKTLALKEGDMVSVTVKNTDTTISQLLRNFIYRVSGNDTYQIGASHGGFVTVNGN